MLFLVLELREKEEVRLLEERTTWGRFSERYVSIANERVELTVQASLAEAL